MKFASLLLGVAFALGMLFTASPQAATQTKHLDVAQPARQGYFAASVGMRNQQTGEFCLISCNPVLILATDSPAIKAAKIRNSVPAQYASKLSLGGSGSRVTPTPGTGWGDVSISYYMDGTREFDSLRSDAPSTDDGLCSFEGVATGTHPQGGPGFVMVTVAGANAFVPTFPGMPADMVEDEVLFQLIGQGVAARFSTPDDRLEEDYGTDFAGDGRVIVIEELDLDGLSVDLKDDGIGPDVVGLIDRTAASIGTSYCGPAVPNSSGSPGRTVGVGSEVVALGELRLHAVDLPANQFGYFLTSQTEGFIPNPGGSNGNLCLGGSIGRFASLVQNSGSEGAIAIEVDLDALPVSPQQPVLPGETWRFQCWFRDIDPGPTSNFTDGIWIEWQ